MSHFKGQNDMRCPVCLFEFQLAALMAAGIRGCPACSTTLQPMKIQEDGYIKVNWQDLRVLAVYAQRWSISFDLQNGGNRDSLRALQNIFSKLRLFTPKGGQPLTPIFEPIIVQNIGCLSEETAELELSDIPMKLEPDATGMIPSPFFKRRPPPKQ